MNHANEILKRLERNTAAGAYLSQVFADWLDLTHATLSALPEHLRSAREIGRLADDTPETQALFARLKARYPQAWAWTNFSEAFAILLNSAEGFWPSGDLTPAPAAAPPGAAAGVSPEGWSPEAISHREAYGWDVVGAVYMQTSAKEHAGQFFTPWCIAEMMARMMIQDGAGEITDRLRQAQQVATARGDPNSHLLAATILAGLCVPKEETTDYFLARILPLIAADFDPITICDPCCGSGVMLLAGARQFPAWAAQAGLVQLYGMDIDQTCVTMAQVNMMLYGLNGAGLHSALTATPRQLASLPEPFKQAYTLALEANASGDVDLVEEIADTLRVQQALFDVDQFTQSPDASGIGGQRTASRPRATVQRPRPQEEATQFIIPW